MSEEQKKVLKPCPFCGGEAKRISDNRIACKQCGVRTGFVHINDLTVENSRIAFTRMLGVYDGDCNNHGDCFYYGSFAGCDAGCPQLIRGECEAWSENIDIIKTDEELMLKYKDKLEELSHE